MKNIFAVIIGFCFINISTAPKLNVEFLDVPNERLESLHEQKLRLGVCKDLFAIFVRASYKLASSSRNLENLTRNMLFEEIEKVKNNPNINGSDKKQIVDEMNLALKNKSNLVKEYRDSIKDEQKKYEYLYNKCINREVKIEEIE